MAEVMHKLATDPMFDFLMKLGIGAAVGWIADKISPLKPGRSLNVLLGITGALVGARVGEVLEISRFGIPEANRRISRVHFCSDRLASNSIPLIHSDVNRNMVEFKSAKRSNT